MKVLMLSWEYPPKNVGGLSNHVYYLSKSLVNKGVEVHIVTCVEGAAPYEELKHGVFVHRVEPYDIETEDFTKWVMQLNFAMIERSITLINEIGGVEVIHAHDWLVTYAAKVLKWAFKIPLVSTIHATEYGRNNGIRTETQKYIASTEYMLTFESCKIIACSNYMRHQINQLFTKELEKIWVIPNGIDCKGFELEFDKENFKNKYAQDYEKIVFYIGRHVFEKGIDVLINAAPYIAKEYNDVKFVIGGIGPMTEELKDKVKNMGMESKFIFTGYMDEESKIKLYKIADIAVFPSLYEPFGIVALEAMASGCPVIVSDVGGFAEIIYHEKNGLTFLNGNSKSLSDNILRIFNDFELSKFLIENAKATIEDKFAWEKIADTTLEMYNKAQFEIKCTDWLK
ncbi:glycosyltransferase family 4 protein [Clostridium sediminicola]|uniref:glycosyltransferase family 4 protein n=1 Tax=Clostridium sediminicola TaxID=3114879 RepID=UPI0031F24CFD